MQPINFFLLELDLNFLTVFVTPYLLNLDVAHELSKGEDVPYIIFFVTWWAHWLPLNVTTSPVWALGSPFWQTSVVRASDTPQLPRRNPICWPPASCREVRCIQSYVCILYIRCVVFFYPGLSIRFHYLPSQWHFNRHRYKVWKEASIKCYHKHHRITVGKYKCHLQNRRNYH